MTYEINFRSKAEKYLSKQPYNKMIRILHAVVKLPYGDVKKMKGYDNLYRLRVGNCRVLFTKSEKTSEIILLDITDIDNRGDIYK